jgi:pimeloyl-ACP methyl ester carboxylesterase
VIKILLYLFTIFVTNLGTVTAAINYYRGLFRYPSEKSSGRVTVPVLIVWGCQDKALGEELANASLKYCDDGELKKIPDASHWVQQDVPDEVNTYVEAFLNKRSST